MDTKNAAIPAVSPASGTRILMVVVAGAAILMWGVTIEGPWLLAGVTIPLICSLCGWWRSRRKLLGSVGWAVAGGFVQSIIFGGVMIVWSLGRKPTGPYQDTGYQVFVTIFAVAMSLWLGVLVGLLVAAGFRLAGVRPSAQEPGLKERGT